MNQVDRKVSRSPSPLRPLASSLTVGAAVLSGLFRVIPHPYNMTPVGALGLYGGARLPLWQALTVPLTVMLITDVILHYTVYPGFSIFNLGVYFSLLLNVLLGRFLRDTQSPFSIGAVSVVGSLQFFLVTNLACWVGSPSYPQTMAGLLQCYAAGLPFASRDLAPPLGFFGNTLVGDLGFVVVLFGLHAALARLAFPEERVAVAPSGR
jgi:hypothetical protein